GSPRTPSGVRSGRSVRATIAARSTAACPAGRDRRNQRSAASIRRSSEQTDDRTTMRSAPRRRRGDAMSDADVVVIGAGLAGWTAALAREAAGAKVRVLEAQQRVGGRVHSMRQLGANAEAGGTYIGAGYTRVIGAAERYGVPLIDVTPLLGFFREQDLVLDGTIIRQADWPTHPANPFPGRDRALLPWNYHRVVTMRDNPLESP